MRAIVSSQRLSSARVLAEQTRVFADGELEHLIGQRVVQHAVRGVRQRRRLVGQRVVVERDTRGGCAEHETDDGDE